MNDAGSRIHLFGMGFSAEDGGAILGRARRMSGAGPRLIVTANIEHVVTLRDDAAFRAAYADAAVRTLDGMPLVWLAKLRGYRDAQRITGHELLTAALGTAAGASDRIFMVSPSEATAHVLAKCFVAAGVPRERIAWSIPPFGFERDVAQGQALADEIATHRTTLLLMGVGAPKSEVWTHRQGAALGQPVVLCIGEALNVAAGLIRRAPPLMQRLGLEWLFRFGTQPRRLFHRYFVRSWRFLAVALANRDLRPAGLPRG